MNFSPEAIKTATRAANGIPKAANLYFTVAVVLVENLIKAEVFEDTQEMLTSISESARSGEGVPSRIMGPLADYILMLRETDGKVL